MWETEKGRDRERILRIGMWENVIAKDITWTRSTRLKKVPLPILILNYKILWWISIRWIIIE